jgi:hypothetical protein
VDSALTGIKEIATIPAKNPTKKITNPNTIKPPIKLSFFRSISHNPNLIIKLTAFSIKEFPQFSFCSYKYYFIISDIYSIKLQVDSRISYVKHHTISQEKNPHHSNAFTYLLICCTSPNIVFSAWMDL